MPVPEVKINPSRWSPSAGRYPEILNQHFSDGQGIRAMIGRETCLARKFAQLDAGTKYCKDRSNQK
jgi:hypothetical protein